jgi:hypothetical protein
MEFQHCSDGCSSQSAMSGFLSEGFYPSAPKRPKFAISEDILHLYHDMITHGPTSKIAFCIAIETLIHRKGKTKVSSTGESHF